MDPLNNIYSPENIARSRARAASMREGIAAGRIHDPDGEYLAAADAIDADADEREKHANSVI
jgi:hypothetical protein